MAKVWNGVPWSNPFPTEEELRTVCRVLREAIEAQEAAVAGAST